jgi:hypothetical protein
MPRNKLPTEQKKVRLMTIYVEPKFVDVLDKSEISKFINQLQTQALDKCVAENYKRNGNK